MEVEHYIDGQHNGGVYNSFYHNTYGYCYQNPVLLVDPNGKQTVNELTSGVKVDMTGAPASSGTNDKGFPRNGGWFWRQVLKTNPEMFSTSNANNVKKGIAPIVDDTWIEHNSSHANYKGDKLVHHHIDQGRFAVGIPEKAHQGMFKQLHNRSAKWFKANGLGKVLNSFVGVGAALDIFKIYSGSPDAFNLQFRPNAPLKEVQGITNGVFGNDYYEITGRNSDSSILNVNWYSGYEKRNGKFRGTCLIESGVMKKNKEGSYDYKPNGPSA